MPPWNICVSTYTLVRLLNIKIIITIGHIFLRIEEFKIWEKPKLLGWIQEQSWLPVSSLTVRKKVPYIKSVTQMRIQTWTCRKPLCPLRPVTRQLGVLLCTSQGLVVRLFCLEQPDESGVCVATTQGGVGPNCFLLGEVHVANWLDLFILTPHEPKSERLFQKVYRPIFSFKNDIIIPFFWWCPYIPENLPQVQLKSFLPPFKPISSCLISSENQWTIQITHILSLPNPKVCNKVLLGLYWRRERCKYEPQPTTSM